MLGLPNLDLKMLVHLIDLHLARYRKLIEAGAAGNRNVNLDECRYLLATWESIETKFKTSNHEELEAKISRSERREIVDAFHDEQS